MTFDRVTVIFNNSQCIELRGCVLYAYRNGVEAGKDGVKPVGKQDGYRFEVRASGITHWRWIGAADYSDRPENSDVVLVDTGIRPLTKEDWQINCHHSLQTQGVDQMSNITKSTYKIISDL